MSDQARITKLNSVGAAVLIKPVQCGKCGEFEYAPRDGDCESLSARIYALEEKLDQLQRERQEPEPLTEEDYKKHVDKHVWAKLPSGKILPCLMVRDIVTRGYGLIDPKYGFWPLNGNITIEVYATEPKGEHHG